MSPGVLVHLRQGTAFEAEHAPRAFRLDARNISVRPCTAPWYGVYRDYMSTLTIGRLAARAGVNVETVRYYERRGLLPEPARTDGRYRQYTPVALHRIEFIKRAKGLGFTLKEIRELLELRVEPGTNCEAVEAEAAVVIARIDTQMAQLERMRSALARLAEACRKRHPTAECPLLEALETEPW